MPQQQRFHSDDKKSVWNLVGSVDWLTHQLYKTVIIRFAVAHLQKNSKFFHSRLGGTLTQTNLHYLPYDYQINNVNFDLCHQY